MGMGMAHSLLNALPGISDDTLKMEGTAKKEKLAYDEGVPVASSEEVLANLKSQQAEVLNTIVIEKTEHEATIEHEDVIPDGRLPVKEEDPLADPRVAEDQLAGPGAGANIKTGHSMSMHDDEHDTSELEKSTLSQNSTSQEPKRVEDHLPSTTSQIIATPSSKRLSTATDPTLITLSSLLTHADALYERYPPTHPDLTLSSIMGPQSVVYTWREPELSPNGVVMGSNEWEEERLADDEAEAMVARPELVVYPYIEEDDDVEVNQMSEEETNGWGWWSEKKAKSDRKQGRSRKGMGKEREKRRPHKLRKNLLSRVEKTMLAGAVLVLGIAMAVYGPQIGRCSSSGWDAHGCANWREWRRMGSWVGGALVGVTDRMSAN